jgi:hypothetical protein
VWLISLRGIRQARSSAAGQPTDRVQADDQAEAFNLSGDPDHGG